ncbi:MAG: winged helix-turn-helix transcriptional regulator [Sphingomonadales bacterium]|nr:winged helix-turn-helix transcriptional regulator [Sphingomonadales bacterium]
MSAQAKLTELDEEALLQAHAVFHAISHPIRINLVRILEEHPSQTVTQLQFRLRLAQALVSVHLAVLRKAGVVTATRSGKHMRYNLDEAMMQTIQLCIQRITG